MDAVTYSNPQVQAELENWNLIKVDTGEHSEVALFFGIRGIPQTVLMTPGGEKNPAVPGFVEPAPFIKMLKEYRESL